jgi:hypothetical protein
MTSIITAINITVSFFLITSSLSSFHRGAGLVSPALS